jgi:hypothetical protein
LNTLTELQESIKQSIVTAREEARLFAEQDKARRAAEAEAAARQAELDYLKVITPYLKKLPEQMREAGKKGLTFVRIKLPEADFVDYNGHRTSTPKISSATARLLRYFKESRLPVETRIVVSQEEDKGTYNERIIWNVYELEVKF